MFSACATMNQHNHNVIRPAINPNYDMIDNLETKAFWCQNVHPYHPTYEKVLDLITNDTIVVENIVEINNPTLKQLYDAKKNQKTQIYGQVYENLLFHGTKKTNVNDICTYNFDWRLYGSNRGHKFGKGVSFSPNAIYASNYSDDCYHRVMIIAKVLIANVCEGHEDMDLPPPGYDTSQKPDGSVVVKYEDNEFYPAYKLYYHFNEDYYSYDYNEDYSDEESSSDESEDDDDDDHYNHVLYDDGYYYDDYNYDYNHYYY